PGLVSHHHAALLLRLEIFGKALLLDLHVDADRIERALGQLVELPVALGRCRGVADDERLAVRLAAIAVGTALVAVAVEDRAGRARIVRNHARVPRVVAGHAGRDGVLRAHRLTLADD